MSTEQTEQSGAPPEWGIKRLALHTNLNSFMANGIKYLVYPDLSVERFEQYEILQCQVSWGVGFQELYDSIVQAFNLLDKGRPASAGVVLNNVLTGVGRGLEKRTSPALLLATLFVVREGENLATWDETLAIEKINDWKAEGYAAADFFSFAFYCVRGWELRYKQSLAGTFLEHQEANLPEEQDHQ